MMQLDREGSPLVRKQGTSSRELRLLPHRSCCRASKVKHYTGGDLPVLQNGICAERVLV